MGKHKTKIERIENAKNRHLAFYKRKKGLLKKAMELSIMWDVHVILWIFNTNSKKWAEFTTMPLQNLIDLYNKIPRKDVAVFSPSINLDYEGNWTKISPLEWSTSTKDQLIKSANKIRESKEMKLKDGDEENKRDSKSKRKQDSYLKDDFLNDNSLIRKSEVSWSDNATQKSGKRENKRRKKSESELSESENSDDDINLESMSDSDENKTQNIDHLPNTTIKQLDEISRVSKIVISPITQNIIAAQKGINLNTAKNEIIQKSEIIEFSPGFNQPENREKIENNEEEKIPKNDKSSENSNEFTSPMILDQNLNSKELNFRKETSNVLNILNQTSKTDENQSFTFENQNQGTWSIKSPISSINFLTCRRDNITVPLNENLSKLKDVPPEEIFASFKQFLKDGGNRNNNDITSPVPFQNKESTIKNEEIDERLMKMLEEISDLDESLATTKEVLKGKVSTLEQGDDDKKNKRKEKLKLKNKGLKLNIPAQNKFLPDVQTNKAEKQSPVRKIYTPTPTKMMITPQMNDSGWDPQMFWNQLSNKWISKLNWESPYMFFQESRGNWYSNFEPKFGTPNRLMSPASQIGNSDFLKYCSMLSGNFMFHDNRESAFMASPYAIPRNSTMKPGNSFIFNHL